MQITPPAQHTPLPTGLSDVLPDALQEIRARLDQLALELRSCWTSALERGDFFEVDPLVEASHAVHRAALALSTDRRLR